MILREISLTKKLIVCTYRIKGTLIKYGWRLDTDAPTTTKLYQPIYEYEYIGEKFLAAYPGFSNIRIPKINSELEFLINPNNPNEYYIEMFKIHKILLSILFGFLIIMGLVFMIYTVLFYK